MTNVLTRSQFIDKFNDIMRRHGQNCGEDSHPLWLAEKFDEDNRIRCKWFVCVKPIELDWQWSNETLAGKITCFSSDDREKEEWWGFTNKKDVIWFLLRFSK